MSEEHHVVDTATGEDAPAEVSEERVQHIFGTIAEQYKKFNAVSSFGLYKGWLRATVDAANLTAESDLLDLAGGTGDVSYMAAQRRKPAHVQLTDFVPEMLAVAKKRYQMGENNGVPFDFEVVDAQDVPYDDCSYDAVTMAYGIRNIPDRMKALSEVHRVLKPGGTFACLEFSTPPNPVWRGLYHVYLKVMIPFWGWLFTKDRPSFVYLADSIRAFPPQEEYAQMLRDAGFKDVTWKNYAGGIVAIHTGTK
ncbi:class I SAM-dependent methyltransferase [Slackia heliotrinireducens]|uniref:class I SAM-dependent methyltransferase n=1 Tax=Slackia heliotrinireducens TaxID=84110 RepID=UPI003315A2C6